MTCLSFLYLIWLLSYRFRYVEREEDRQALIRERLEFKRIFSSPSGKKVFGELKEWIVETKGTDIGNEASSFVGANCDSETDSTLSPNDNSSLVSTDSSVHSKQSLCVIHTIDPTEVQLDKAETGSKTGTIASQDCCSICLETYAVGDSIARVKKVGSKRRCNHWFHEECILEWLQHHNECPLCRMDMINTYQKETILTRTMNYGTLRRAPTVAAV